MGEWLGEQAVRGKGRYEGGLETHFVAICVGQYGLVGLNVVGEVDDVASGRRIIFRMWSALYCTQVARKRLYYPSG